MKKIRLFVLFLILMTVNGCALTSNLDTSVTEIEEQELEKQEDGAETLRYTLNETISENLNRRIDAYGYDADGNITCSYIALVEYFDLDDDIIENDVMHVAIESYDSDGKLIWRNDDTFNEYVVTELGDFNFLLIDRNDNAIIENLNYENGSLRCLSAGEGKPLWEKDVFAVDILQLGNGRYYYTQYYGEDLVCLSEKGEIVWTRDISDNGNNYWPRLDCIDGQLEVYLARYADDVESSMRYVFDPEGNLIFKEEILEQ